MKRRAALATVVVTLLSACAGREDQQPSKAVDDPVTSTAEVFVDVAAATGLDFRYFNGMSGEHYFNEVMGGGAALFDYDNDGDLDIYLVQGHMLGRDKTAADSPYPLPHPEPLVDRLFRNDLGRDEDGSPIPTFVDITEQLGVQSAQYGMGVAAGDYDNDGYTDLFVTNFGPNQLLRNRGDGTFEDVTARAGVDDRRWSIAATFFDLDHDGWLDLYVGNYVEFSLAGHAPCPLASGVETYCGPGAYRPEPDTLFRNRGDGTFEDVTARAGMKEEGTTTLGVVAVDVDGDRWTDLYVANDLMSNRLWMNQRDGSFQDEALLAGVAVNRDGQPEASMGVDAGDFDQDGDPDILLTHLEHESHTLYSNDGTGMFEDISTRSGLGAPSLLYTGFGAAWIDYDNDSWLDVLAVNGAVIGVESLIRDGDPYPLRQSNQLFRNLGDGRFEEATDQAGATLGQSEVSRGAAFGDVDNDGDTDVVIVNSNGPTRLLLNQIGSANMWTGLRIVGDGRDLLGTVTLIERGTGPALRRHVHADGSYASASDPRVLTGLGTSSAPARVKILWPDGRTTVWNDVPAGHLSTAYQQPIMSP